MAIAFLHNYELTIGTPSRLLTASQTPTTAIPAPGALEVKPASDVVTGGGGTGYVDYCTATPEALSITDLQIEAKVDYNLAPTGKGTQPAVIKVYNLTDTNVNFITAESTVILKAGYRKDQVLPIIYSGQVTKVSTEKVGPDYITTIVCGDGKNVLKNTTYSKTYLKTTTYEAVINDMLTQFADRGLPTNQFTLNQRTSRALSKALVKEGSLSTSLTDVCNDIDYGWYITLGKLNVHPKEQDGLIESVDIIANNVKGVISLIDDKATVKTFSAAAKPQGIKLTTFLNGQITTNTTLNVKFGAFEGTYKITSVTHKLNFRGNIWDTEVECTRIS